MPGLYYGEVCSILGSVGMEFLNPTGLALFLEPSIVTMEEVDAVSGCGWSTTAVEDGAVLDFEHHKRSWWWPAIDYFVVVKHLCQFLFQYWRKNMLPVFRWG